MDLTSDDVRDVLRLLDSMPYDELRLETDRFTLTLRRTPGGGWTQEREVRSEPNVITPADAADPADAAPAPAPAEAASRAPTTAPPTHVGGDPRVDDRQDPGNRLSTGSTGATGSAGAAGSAGGHGQAGNGGRARDGLLEVRAPLLGTFYRAPKPGAPPFVEVGGAVTEDTVIGLVETMKLFTSVYARVRGTVAEFCLGDAQFAAEGAVLARVDPEAAERAAPERP